MDNLLRFKFNQRYVIFDFETEGLSLVSSRPWQVSWGVAEGRKLLSVHNHYIAWEDLNISEKAAAVTRFDKADYIRRREDPFHVFPKLWQDINDENNLLVGHNILQFDIYILNIYRQKLGLPTDYKFLDRCLDTNALSIAVKKGLQPPNANGSVSLSWQYRLLNARERGVKTNMGAMLKHYDIPHESDKLHDAEYDIRKNFELFHKLIQDIEI